MPLITKRLPRLERAMGNFWLAWFLNPGYWSLALGKMRKDRLKLAKMRAMSR